MGASVSATLIFLAVRLNLPTLTVGGAVTPIGGGNFTHFQLVSRVVSVRPAVCGEVVDRVLTHTVECIEPWLVGTQEPPANDDSSTEEDGGGRHHTHASVGRWRTGWYFASPSCINDDLNQTGSRAVFVTGLENSGTSAVTAALRMQGKLQEAILDLERAIPDAGPKRGEANRMLIQTYNDLGVRLAKQQVATRSPPAPGGCPVPSPDGRYACCPAATPAARCPRECARAARCLTIVRTWRPRPHSCMPTPCAGSTARSSRTAPPPPSSSTVRIATRRSATPLRPWPIWSARRS